MSPIPKGRVCPDCDRPLPGCEAARIVKKINQQLFYLHLIDMQLARRRTHLHAELDIFRFEHRLDLMDCLRDARLNVTHSARRITRRVRSNAHLEHGGRQPRKASDAALHPFQGFRLLGV